MLTCRRLMRSQGQPGYLVFEGIDLHLVAKGEGRRVEEAKTLQLMTSNAASCRASRELAAILGGRGGALRCGGVERRTQFANGRFRAVD